MEDPGLRRRVERLLHGDFRIDDLTRLFLAVRSRSYGRQSVKEIGDFVAHADKREKGITTNAARDFFAHLRFRVPYYQRALDVNDLPANFPRVMRGNFKRLDLKMVQSHTGIKPKVADRILSSLLSKFSTTPTGRCALSAPLNEEEAELLKCVAGWVVAKPAFTDDSLFEEFQTVLEKNKLLRADEKQAFFRLKPLIALFAITSMHQCIIVLEDGPPAELMADCHNQEKTLTVLATALCPDEKIPTLHFSASIFSTSLRATDWCDAPLLEGTDQDKWLYPIELGPDKKLRRM